MNYLISFLEIAGIIHAMIIFAFFSFIAIISLHLLVVSSIDDYDNYGNKHAAMEWSEFEKKYSAR
jgi:hypothetical protein